jgi:hypothetical protein
VNRFLLFSIFSVVIAGQATAQSAFQKVKTAEEYVVYNSDPRFWPFVVYCERTSFSPQSPAAVISPYSNDPGVPTTSNLLYPVNSCPLVDLGGGVKAYSFYFHPRSLKDLGGHSLSCTGYWAYISACWPDNSTPCGFSCPASAIYAFSEPVQGYISVYNVAPHASPSSTPASPAWSDTVTLRANSSDADSGSLQHRWSITQKPPEALATLSNAQSANATITFASDKDIGTWVFRLEVDDDEGELKSFSYQVTVPNIPPDFEPTGATQVVVNQPIQLGVTKTTDTDGGNLTFSWDILQAPPAATPQVQTGYSTQPTVTIPTASGEIGTWRFSVTAKDNENASVPKEITVEVINKPPRISLSGASQIDEGTPLHVETTIVDDEDGGLLSFQWKVVQAPLSAGVLVPSVLSTNAALDLPPSQAVAGSWIFRLIATDDEGESVHGEISVLVDGPVYVDFVSRPSFHVIGSGPLILDASASYDADTPCPESASGCHLTDGRFATVSAGIASYAWYASPNLSQQPLQRIQQLFPHINDSGPVLTFGPEDLAVGEWTFELRILDAEGNEGVSQFVVPVYLPDTAPRPILVGPALRPTVFFPSGLLLVDVIVDGAQSIDIDNTFDGTPASPGLGISNYHWEAIPPTPGCSAPVLPSGPGISSIVLIPGGSIVPPACQGRWTVRLTVTDDDTAAQMSVATIPVTIGNCYDLVCLDAPVPGNEADVLMESPPQLITLHVDSAFYDEPLFVLGARVRMDVVHPGTSIPVFTASTPVLNQASRGQPLFLSWNGQAANGSRVEGTFDIVLSLETQAGTAYGIARGSNVITVERVQTEVRSPSDTFVQHEKLRANTSPATFTVTASGALPSHPLTAIQWRVKRQNGTLVASGTMPVGSGDTHSITWDGKSGTTLQPPGHYTFEAECTRNGHVFALSAPHAFVIFSTELHPVVTASGASGNVPAWVHLERRMIAPDVSPANFAERRLKMSPLKVIANPLVEGATVTLELESGPANQFELYEAGTQYRPVTLPKQWAATDVSSLDLNLLAYGKGPGGEAIFKLTYRAGAQVLAEERVRYRLTLPPTAAGVENLGQVPHFQYVRTVNTGSPVRVALDPFRHRERSNRHAQVHLVPHRNDAQWALDAALNDATGGSDILSVGAANAASDILTIWNSAVAGSYDIVYDFGNFAEDPSAFVADNRLDPGDILISPDETPGLEVEGSYVAVGPHPIKAVQYGEDEMPPHEAFIPRGWDGVQDAGGGLGGYKFPLKGQAIYPANIASFSTPLPVVIIAHGRHLPKTVYSFVGGIRAPYVVAPELTSAENYQGYTYLQEHLASRGYITISVDLDSTFGDLRLGYPGVRSSSGIQVRAWIILKTLEMLLTDNQALDNLVTGVSNRDLVGKIDPNKIYLVGHSRGGEAAIVAYHQLVNLSLPPASRDVGALPPGGTLGGPMTPSSIQGIVSLAPVSSAVEMGTIRPPEVPFLLLYGSADGDVNGATRGARPFIHYDRAQSDRFAIRIEGGNHNSFNTSWGYSDASHGWHYSIPAPPHPFTHVALKPLDVTVGNPATLLSAPQQRDVAKSYLTAFLLMLNEQELGAREYFLHDPSKLTPQGVPAGIQLHSQVQLRQAASRHVIDDFEGGAFNPAQSSSGQPVTYTVEEVAELGLLDSDLNAEGEPQNRFFQATQGTLFSWDSDKNYEQQVHPSYRDLRTARSLNFRVAQQPLHPRTSGGALRFKVEMEDSGGRTGHVSVQAFAAVAGIYEAKIWNRSRYLADGSPDPNAVLINTTSAAFQTYRLPVLSFLNPGSDLDLGTITKIRFHLGIVGETPQGRLAVDDLELEF